MKVKLSQHGGQAAGINLQRPPLVVDSGGFGRFHGFRAQDARGVGRFSAPARALGASAG